MPDPVSAIVAGTVGSGIANIFGASKGKDDIQKGVQAANAQANAMLDRGLGAQKDYFSKGYDVLSPVATQGSDVYNKLVGRLDDLTAPIVMDQAALEKTPGYQFNVGQGVRAIDLSSVSRGMSGAQAKAAAQFGVNTANTLYKDQWDMAYKNKEAAFNRLLATAGVGADAAKSIASNATSAGNTALTAATGTGKTLAENTMAGAKGEAAADVSMFKSIGDTISGVSGLYANKKNINNLLA